MIKYYHGNRTSKLLWSESMSIKVEYESIYDCICRILNEITTSEILTIDFIFMQVIPQFVYYFQLLMIRHVDAYFLIMEQCLTIIKQHSCSNKRYIIDNIEYTMGLL